MDKKGIKTMIINRFANNCLNHKFRKGLQFMQNNLLKVKGENLKVPKSASAPVIILGMHRSGTTMLSKIMRKTGVNFGWLRGNDTDESLFFQSLNNAIFSQFGASWDEPEALKLALEDKNRIDGLADNLTKFSTERKWTYSFLGKDVFSHSSLFDLSSPWGWKDPRTCYTLPLWLKLFPEAKIIFIYRNGVDVANSLYERNSKFKLGSKTCSTLLGAFQLWDKYNTRCIELIRGIPSSQLYQIKYEDLLSSPSIELNRLNSFLGLDVSNTFLDKICSQILSRRAFAYKGNEELEVLYESIKSNKLMTDFGYTSL